MTYALYTIAALFLTGVFSTIHRAVNKRTVEPPTAAVAMVMVVFNLAAAGVLIAAAQRL